MKYRTIVIDPPWKLYPVSSKALSGGKFRQNLPYTQMTDEEILAFPIDNFADNECDLFLWATQGKLPVALKCLDNWGFKYHCLLTWDKLNGISINGFQRRTELVLYGYKGRMGVDRKEGHYIPTLFSEASTNHSAKPRIFYAFLRERTLEPRIDIFARKRHYGFDAYGNQVETQIEIPLFITQQSKREKP